MCAATASLELCALFCCLDRTMPFCKLLLRTCSSLVPLCRVRACRARAAPSDQRALARRPTKPYACLQERQIFSDELQLSAKFSHRNIVFCYGGFVAPSHAPFPQPPSEPDFILFERCAASLSHYIACRYDETQPHPLWLREGLDIGLAILQVCVVCGCAGGRPGECGYTALIQLLCKAHVSLTAAQHAPQHHAHSSRRMCAWKLQSLPAGAVLLASLHDASCASDCLLIPSVLRFMHACSVPSTHATSSPAVRLQALHYVHPYVTHGDLSSSNVLVKMRPNNAGIMSMCVMLADFETARVVERVPEQHGDGLGTAAFIPPLRDDAAARARGVSEDAMLQVRFPAALIVLQAQRVCGAWQWPVWLSAMSKPHVWPRPRVQWYVSPLVSGTCQFGSQ